MDSNSNSKLTPEQKQTRKDMLAELPSGSVIGLTEDGVTILVVPTGGNVVQVTTAVASPDEQKVRRKVGEYWALQRRDIGETIPMPVGAGADFVADELAENFGGWVWDEAENAYKTRGF